MMDLEILELLAAPFFASVILASMHAYLGLHVVERGVIFVDLALAQVAVLGTSIGFLIGGDLHEGGAYWWSLGFTIVSAAVFTLTRTRRHGIPQEALIGIVYAVSASLSIAVLSRAPEGADHLKDLLVGTIIVVSWDEITTIGVLYAVIGCFHWFVRKPILHISLDPEGARSQGLAIEWWDFLFYITFGVVVTYAVSIAGVLLVFTYLIVPSVFAIMFSDRVGVRLMLSLGLGVVVSAAGVILSFQLDWPTGETIICTYGLALILSSLVYLAVKRKTPAPDSDRYFERRRRERAN